MPHSTRLCRIRPVDRPATARSLTRVPAWNPKIGFGLSPDPDCPGRRRGQVWGLVCCGLRGCGAICHSSSHSPILDQGPGLEPQNRVWVISRSRGPSAAPRADLETGLPRSTRLPRLVSSRSASISPDSKCAFAVKPALMTKKGKDSEYLYPLRSDRTKCLPLSTRLPRLVSSRYQSGFKVCICSQARING